MFSFARRCLALTCLAAPAFAAAPPSADVARTQLVEAVTCQRHLTPEQFDAMAKVLMPGGAKARDEHDNGYTLAAPLTVLGLPVTHVNAYDGSSGEDGVDSYTAYFGSTEISKVAALAKMPPPVAGSYRREVGRHDLVVNRLDGQTILYCEYDLRGH
ncbi:hypothetical protein I5U67_17525 [Stenotrophomonas maltophilia]|uniref:Uncharacterized protein n=2 Tax=Stenotrophomonas maltophilia TaxID=40324 RepID=A0A6B8JBG5_STEMA|nr:hypothetical protein [Stenotrophomonas maltophilia]MBH1653964.1 hypothetical protein [Stenotrophomonas maltophilia]QGM03242.1 hypothetical protein FEO89_01595 [Stenotrophomonas maltophilia]HDS1509625.1 hypothetical protein [Stenotrophomonas maltophilia]